MSSKVNKDPKASKSVEKKGDDKKGADKKGDDKKGADKKGADKNDDQEKSRPFSYHRQASG